MQAEIGKRKISEGERPKTTTGGDVATPISLLIVPHVVYVKEIFEDIEEILRVMLLDSSKLTKKKCEIILKIERSFPGELHKTISD